MFARAVADQTKGSFMDRNVRALEYRGGCPECLVPDNMKGAVIHACCYDLEINRTFAAMAEHQSSTKPKDKVENGVLQAQRRILAVLRNRTFFSIAELNRVIC
jgi:transposase